MNNPLLFFSMQLDSTPQLNIGRLFLMDLDKGGITNWWMATSGIGDWQDRGDWSHQGGGVIPPTYKLKGCNFYRVSTKPVWQSLGGIDTNTYAISPVAVVTQDGVERSELLIHRSRYSSPQSGSLGCIVLKDSEFKDFEKVFATTCGQLESVRLLVGYTFD